MLRVLLVSIILLFVKNGLLAQCPGSGTCQGAYVFCLDELNGFSCSTAGGAESPCFQPCSANGFSCVIILGQPCLSTWWAFVSDTDYISITLNSGFCADVDFDNDYDGIIWGIQGDCQCNEEIFCSSPYQHPANPGESWTFEGHVEPCKTYYIWINGTEGDICFVNFGTSGGGLCNTDKIGEPRKVCAGYKWHSQYIYETGTYRTTYKDNRSCSYDSIVDFTVFPVPEPPDFYYITCDNKPYIDILGRKYYPCLEQIEISLPKSTDPNKCDSSFILTAINVDLNSNWRVECLNGKVAIAANTNLVNPCNLGESYEFEYRWYKKNDQFKTTISTNEILVVASSAENYCLDVDVKVNLGTTSTVCIKTFCEKINESLYNSTNDTMKLFYCDSAIVNNQKYFQDTKFVQYLKNIAGCDSVIQTELSIAKSTSSILALSSCDSALINGQTYFQTGRYSQILNNENNCDSILNIDLNIKKSSFTELNYTGCDSIILNGQTYAKSGRFVQILQGTNSCDSIINLDVNISGSSKEAFSLNACDSVIFNGQTYLKSGDYTQAYTNTRGCDSILDLHINITNSNSSPLILTHCDSIDINGIIYNQSGIYQQSLKTTNGCDSLLNIHLTIAKSISSSYTYTSCDSASINGQVFTQSGNYKQVLKTINQCDSTLNLEIRIHKSSQAEISQTNCDSIVVNGQTYKMSGTYSQILSNANLCDSVLTINFTQLSSSSSNLTYTSCDSLIVNNQVYKQSGNYTQALTNSNNCDSVLNLSVDIRKSGEAQIGKKACDSTVINGQTYFQSGKYKQLLSTTDQCDSIININLDIYHSKSANHPLNVCDSAVINGQIYKSSGNYVQVLKTKDQCDSTLKIQLDLSRSTIVNLSQNACDSSIINGIKYLSSGTYEQRLINRDGCDSTLKIELTIKPGNNLSLDAGKDKSICEGEIVKLNGVVSQGVDLQWSASSGSFDNSNKIITNYYPDSIGDKQIYLQAIADCGQLLDSLTIHVWPNQFVRVTGDSILDPCKPELKFTATGGTSYTWTPASYIDCLDPPCSKVKLKSNLAARFTITTDGPCSFPASLNLSSSQIEADVFLPNAFSPNGDNINDIFLPVFHCEQITFYHLQIFDRWGNLIFESTNKDLGWNGKKDEVQMMPGVYPYVIEYEIHNSAKKIKAGDVTLIK